MIKTICHLWATQRVALLAFVAALCLVVFFTFNAVAHAVYWMDPRHQDQALAPWMTPRYVARSYDLPPDIINNALLITHGETPRGITMRELAATHKTTLDALQERVETAATAHRSSQPDG